MTDIATDFAPGAGPAPADAGRRDAFRAAGRHTARVRILRRLVLAGAVGGSLLVVVFAFFNPFRLAIPNVSIEGLGLNGTKVTMDHPKLSGFRSDGRPYDLVAKSAVQDARTPSVLELHEIDAHVTMADKSVIHIVSDAGTYDSTKETMQLSSAIHLTSDNGMDATMKSAFIAFKSGVVDTREPLTIVTNTGTITADSMHMTDNGKVATFEGHVHTVVKPTPKAAAAADARTGAAP